MKINGENLRIAIKGADLTTGEAAKRLDISRQTLFTRFKDTELDIDFILKVKRVLNIDLGEVDNQHNGENKSLIAHGNNRKGDGDIYDNKNDTLLIGTVPAPGEETSGIPLGNNKFGLTVPLIPVRAYAGYLDNYGDPEFYETLDKYTVTVMGQYRGVYLAFVVSGDSMENYSTEELAKASIPEGSIVTGREIQKHHWRNKLHLHRFQFYVIVHNEGIITKQITEHNVAEGYIICHSLNEKYADRKIMLDDCVQILNIVHKGAAL